MSGIVVDCSVTAAWLLGEDDTDAAWSPPDGRELNVPALWIAEMANVILLAQRRKRLTAAEARAAEHLAATLPVVVDPAPPSLGTLCGLGRDFGLTAYDASYLELALRRGLTMMSFDKALLRAARKAGVRPD